MKINIEFVGIPASESLETYTNNKLQNLFNKYSDIINTTVFFKKEKCHHKIGCVCEMQISLNGPRIFASSNEKNFELAIKHTISDLNKLLKKRKGILKPYV